MASSQGRMSAADRAGDVAQRLDQGWIGPEHFLLAMVYGEHTVGPPLHQLGSSERPPRGFHRIEVTEAELKPLLNVLIERYPPDSDQERSRPPADDQ